jgi:hypothetical protein
MSLRPLMAAFRRIRIGTQNLPSRRVSYCIYWDKSRRRISVKLPIWDFHQKNLSTLFDFGANLTKITHFYLNINQLDTLNF